MTDQRVTDFSVLLTNLGNSLAGISSQIAAIEAAIPTMTPSNAGSIVSNLLATKASLGAATAQVDDAETVSPALSNLTTHMSDVEAQMAFVLGVYKTQAPTPVITISNNTVADNAASTAPAGTLNTNMAGTITWSGPSNAKFDLTQDGSAVATLTLNSSGAGHITAGHSESVTISATNGIQTVQQGFTISVISGSSSPMDWHTPPAHPANKINIKWIGGVDATVSPALASSSAIEGSSCWKVVVPGGQIAQLAPFNNRVFNTLSSILTTIGPPLQSLGGVEATIDDGYYRITQTIQHTGSPSVPACNWCWQAQTAWDNHYPWAGGVHLRQNSTLMIASTIDDQSLSSLITLQNVFIGPFPSEVQWKGTGTVGGGATTLASFPTSALSNPPLQTNGYTNNGSYILRFDGNVTSSLKGFEFKITGNDANPLPTITTGSSHAVAAGDTFVVESSFQWGGSTAEHIRINTCGIFVMDHVGIYRSGGNGVQCSDYGGWDFRSKGRIYEFDCFLAACGGSGAQHNRYIHSVGLYVTQRSFSHSSAGHQMKWECDRGVSIDESVYGHLEGYRDWGNNNVCMNCTEGNQIYIKNLRVQPTNYNTDYIKHNWFTIDCRSSCASAFYSGLPTYFKKQTNTRSGLRVGPGQEAIEFVNAGSDANGVFPPKVNVGMTSAAYTGSVTSINIKGVGSVLGNPSSGYIKVDLTAYAGTATSFDLEMRRDDGTVYQGTMTITSAVAGSNPVYTCAISPALGGNVASGRTIVLKKSADAWDRPILDASCRDFHDPSSPTYVWGTGGILDSGGNLDFTKQKRGATAHYWPAQYMDGVFLTPTMNNLSISYLVQVTRETYLGFLGNGGITTYPFPPLKSSVGAWADPANAGEFDCRIHGSSDSPPSPVLGKNGTGVAAKFTRPNAFFVSNATWNTQGMNALSTQFATNTGGGPPPEVIEVPVHGWILNTGGTLTPVADNAVSAPLPAPVMFTAAGSTAAGGNTVQVSSPVGLSNGMFISLGVDNQWGSDLGVHNATISGIIGNAVTFTPALPTGARTFKAISPGNKCAAVAAAGSKPAWWLDVDTDFLT